MILKSKTKFNTKTIVFLKRELYPVVFIVESYGKRYLFLNKMKSSVFKSFEIGRYEYNLYNNNEDTMNIQLMLGSKGTRSTILLCGDEYAVV